MMKTTTLLALAAIVAGCGTVDRVLDRRVNYAKCVAALTAGGVSQGDAERVCKKLSENADGVAALRDAI